MESTSKEEVSKILPAFDMFMGGINGGTCSEEGKTGGKVWRP